MVNNEGKRTTDVNKHSRETKHGRTTVKRHERRLNNSSTTKRFNHKENLEWDELERYLDMNNRQYLHAGDGIHPIWFEEYDEAVKEVSDILEVGLPVEKMYAMAMGSLATEELFNVSGKPEFFEPRAWMDELGKDTEHEIFYDYANAFDNSVTLPEELKDRLVAPYYREAIEHINNDMEREEITPEMARHNLEIIENKADQSIYVNPTQMEDIRETKKMVENWVDDLENEPE